MFQMYAEMPTSHDDPCYKDVLADKLDEYLDCKTERKTMCMEGGRGRTKSDDLSTAAPSPEASPLFGPQSPCFSPQSRFPSYGLDELVLPDLELLPEAQDSMCGSEAQFELAGFDDEESELAGCDEEEDAECQLLALLGELAALRAECRQPLGRPDSGLQKIPYPELESGFLPAQYMPTESWLMPAGRAETGQWAYAMAPRPSNSGMEPLNIVLSKEGGATLEVCVGIPEECWRECERKSLVKAKAVFRRKRGRSRSPVVLKDEEERWIAEGRKRGRSLNGRSRRWTC